MDIDCQKVIRIIGRRCNWEQKVPVPDDEEISFALKSTGLSENLSFLCIEELLKNRYITKKTIITNLRIKVTTTDTRKGLNSSTNLPGKILFMRISNNLNEPSSRTVIIIL